MSGNVILGCHLPCPASASHPCSHRPLVYVSFPEAPAKEYSREKPPVSLLRAESPVLTRRPIMMEAENFTIFIKNSIRFPLFNFEK